MTLPLISAKCITYGRIHLLEESIYSFITLNKSIFDNIVSIVYKYIMFNIFIILSNVFVISILLCILLNNTKSVYIEDNTDNKLDFKFV